MTDENFTDIQARAYGLGFGPYTITYNASLSVFGVVHDDRVAITVSTSDDAETLRDIFNDHEALIAEVERLRALQLAGATKFTLRTRGVGGYGPVAGFTDDSDPPPTSTWNTRGEP